MKRTFTLYMSLYPLLFHWKMVQTSLLHKMEAKFLQFTWGYPQTLKQSYQTLYIHSASESPREPVKHLFQGSIPTGSDSAILGRSLRIYISSKLSGNAQAAGPWASPGSIQTRVTHFISFLFVSFYCDKYNQ